MQPTALKFFGVIATLALGAFSIAQAADAVEEKREAHPAPSWHSQSLTTETVTGPNGAVTTDTALSVNSRRPIARVPSSRAIGRPGPGGCRR